MLLPYHILFVSLFSFDLEPAAPAGSPGGAPTDEARAVSQEEIFIWISWILFGYLFHKYYPLWGK